MDKNQSKRKVIRGRQALIVDEVKNGHYRKRDKGEEHDQWSGLIDDIKNIKEK